MPTPGLISRLQIFPDPIDITVDLIQASLASDTIGRDEGKNFKDDQGRVVDGDPDEGTDEEQKFKDHIMYPGIQEPGRCRKRGVVRAIMPN